MVGYKRNQVEEAISRLVEPRAKKPSEELRTRLKRLLDTDRVLGRSPRTSEPERMQYAFFSTDAPGRGTEVWFSGYEAFALYMGLGLMHHGWPQGFAVSVMRRVRVDLEHHHARILRQDPQTLFDDDAIRRDARAGDMALNNTDPAFLVVVSSGLRESATEPAACEVRRGQKDLMKFVGSAARAGGAATMFEIVSTVHKLADCLAQTEPQRRGRS